MAKQGDLYLSIADIVAMFDYAREYGVTVQDAFYAQYKNAYKLSVSNHFRGEAADSFKTYLTDGAINIIRGLMDVAADMTMIIQYIAEVFFQYESTHNGKVEEAVLDYIEKGLASKKSTFDSAVPELDSVLSAAAQYITTAGLELDGVEEGYSDAGEKLKSIRENLYDFDEEALKSAAQLYERIVSVQNLIRNTMGHCYTLDGKLKADQINNVRAQGWFEETGNVALYLKLQEDPFEYSAGEVTVAEDQWAAGLCSDVYAYAGYSFLSASYEAGVEDGTAFVKAKASVATLNGYAQFTDYLRAQAEVKVAYAEGEAKIGASDKYFGFHVEGEVGLIDAEGSVVLGSDNLNAFVKGEAKVLCADGKAAFEFEEDGQFAIGVDGSATLASASVSGGTTILGYKNKDSATGEKETLLGFKVGAKADAGGSFALWAESKTAIETDFGNINATTVKIDAALLLGVELELTVPTFWPKWPW